MEVWKKYKIEDTSIALIDGDRGKNYPKNSEFCSMGYCLFLNAGNVTSRGFLFYDNSFISKEKDLLLGKGRVERNDVIITTRGTVGNVALYDDNIPYKHLRINSGMLIVKSGKEILPKYLYYYLKSPLFQSQIESFKSGSAQPQLPKSTMKKMTISYPDSLSVQQKITDILSSLDYKIENNRRINDNLGQQAHALFKSWFVDFKPFKDGEFVESELGMIPKGWCVEALGNVTTPQHNKVKTRTDVKVLSPVTTGQLVLSEDYFTKQVFSESVEKYIVVEPFDFAYNPARVNIGSFGMNAFDFDGCVSPVYVVFRCEDNYHYFFDLFRKTTLFKEEVKTRAIGGVRQTLSYKDFALIKVVYPPKEVVNDFNRIYTTLLSLKEKNNKENAHLTALRDTLLPRLMSGELNLNEL